MSVLVNNSPEVLTQYFTYIQMLFVFWMSLFEFASETIDLFKLRWILLSGLPWKPICFALGQLTRHPNVPREHQEWYAEKFAFLCVRFNNRPQQPVPDVLLELITKFEKYQPQSKYWRGEGIIYEVEYASLLLPLPITLRYMCEILYAKLETDETTWNLIAEQFLSIYLPKYKNEPSSAAAHPPRPREILATLLQKPKLAPTLALYTVIYLDAEEKTNREALENTALQMIALRQSQNLNVLVQIKDVSKLV